MEEQGLFAREEQVIAEAEDLLASPEFRDGSCADRYEELLRHYRRMLDQVKRIMRIADRFEDALRTSVKEQEVLLREVHHRVKNNLAAIIGMLNLQGKALAKSPTSAVLVDLADRIRAMALVHEILYRSEKLSTVDCQAYFKALSSHLGASLSPSGLVGCNVEATGVMMNLDTAIPCGMIVNELITNALKHAFPGDKARCGANRCRMDISLRWDGASYTLVVSDNGVGLPPDMDWTKTETLGLRLVKMLGEHQLGARVQVDRAGGTRFTLEFGSKQAKTPRGPATTT